MKKIVVTNLYGKNNIGDMAIRNSALNILEESLGINDFYLLCESKEDFPIQSNIKSKLNIEWAPYGYAIRANDKPLYLFIKFFRFIKILSISIFYAFLGMLNINFLPKKGFYKYIRLIAESESVIAMGGGYFITSQPVKDFFGICLNVLPILIAKVYKKKIVILPSSFGPFALKIHELITGYAVKNTLFMARENISLNYVTKYCNNTKYIPDLALYDWGKESKAENKDYYVLTFREGLVFNKQKQIKVENEIVKFIKKIWEQHKLYCIFIPIASNPIEENDLVVANRLEKLIGSQKIFKICSPKSPEEVKNILINAKFSICNRLHSAILSATVYTPFITISYAHKTNGFMKSFGLEEWNIDMQDITFTILIDKFNKLLSKQNYQSFIEKLKINRKEIAKYKLEIIKEIKNLTN